MAETDALLPNDNRRKTLTVNLNEAKTQTEQTHSGDEPNQGHAYAVRRTWRHFMLLVVVFLEFFGGGFASYIINEWIHARLKDEANLSNFTSRKNASDCIMVSNHSDPNYRASVRIQQKTAEWQMYYEIAYSSASVLATIFLPPLTDFYGRKFLIVGSLLGIFIKRVALVFIVYFNLDFIYIVISYAVEGLLGGSFSLMSASYSSAADVNPKSKDRTLAIVVMEAITIFSAVLSGLGIGLYIQYYGYIYPAITSAGTATLALILSLLVIPETLKSPRDHVRPTPMQSLQRLVGFYTSKEFKGQRLQYVCLLMAFIWRQLSSMHRSSMETTYQLGMPFCWSPSMIGYYVSLRRFGEGVIGMGSIRLLQRCLSDEFIVILSTVSTSASFILEAFATTDVMMFMVPVIAVFSILSVPVIRSIMSLMTPASKQGALFAGISLMEVIASASASVIDNNIYMATVSFLNGFIFLALSGFNFVALIFLLVFAISKKKTSKEKQLN